MRSAASDTSVIPAWARFLLRLAACALPFLTYAHGLASGSGPLSLGSEPLSLGDGCARAELELLLWALVLPSIVALVCAANMVGRRQRYALATSAVLAGSWLIIAIATLWIRPGTCELGIS